MSGIEDQGLRPGNVESAPPAEPDDDRADEGAESGVGDVPAGRAGADSGAVPAVRVDPDDESGLPDASTMNDEPGVGPRRPRDEDRPAER